jgi:flagellar protein FliS
MQHGQVAAKGELISKAIGIIGGLREGLNLQSGGEIAANLDRLYEYMIARLVEANLSNDVALIDEVAGLLRNVKSGWDAISH